MQNEIEQMAKVMNECCNRYDENGNHIGNKCYECDEWSDDNHCCCSYNTKEAMALYNAGYRKSSEVAREIFAEIEKVLRENQFTLIPPYRSEITDWKTVFRLKLADDIAELKKKYTEEGK